MLRNILCAFALLSLASGCKPEGAKEKARPAGAATKQTTASTPESWETLPSRDTYAGSATCKECHEKNYAAWTKDWHSRALSKPAKDTLVARFDHTHFRGASSEAWMEHTGPRYTMRTRGRDGKVATWPVSWLIGGKRMQDTVTIFDDGRWQVLPVYFHVTGKSEWVDYNEAKQGAVAPDHPFYWTNFRRTANKECLDCHATGLDLRYEPETRLWTTSFADPGVACEACHGPGARHAETKAKSDIVHPAHVSKEVGLAICGRCHGPREPVFPVLDTKDTFHPGQRYNDRYQALVIVDGRERSGEYFADGRPSSSSFEYQALLQSRCHLSGGATCLTCHTAPHHEHGANEIKGDVEQSCHTCHAAIAAAGEAHTHHRSAAGSSCTGCHMPKLVSGVLDKFADHTIDVPNVRNTIVHGVPNACGVCHGEKNPHDLSLSIAKWWPDAAARNHRRDLLADAIDEHTSAQSLPALTAVLHDATESGILRGALAVLLAQRFPHDAPPLLEPLLHDRDEVVRARAVEAIGFADARGTADSVATLLNDPSLQVRQTAVLVLASFHDPRAAAALDKLANDPATTALFRPHVMRGISAGNRGDFETAAREIDAALARAPYVVDALVFRADLDARRGNLAGARHYLEEALRFDPSHKGARGRLAAMSGH